MKCRYVAPHQRQTMWHLHLICSGTLPSLCFIYLFELIYGSWTHILWPTDSGAKPPSFPTPSGVTGIPAGSFFLIREMGVIIVFASTCCSEGHARNALSTGRHMGRAFDLCWRKHLEVSGMARISSDQTEGQFTKFLTWVSLCLSCGNKTPRTGQLKREEFTFPRSGCRKF